MATSSWRVGRLQYASAGGGHRGADESHRRTFHARLRKASAHGEDTFPLTKCFPVAIPSRRAHRTVFHCRRRKSREVREFRLRTNGAISHADVLSNFIAGFLNITSVSVTVDQSAGSALATEQVVHRRTESLTFDIPEREIHSGSAGHGHGATTPIGAPEEILPNIVGLKGIASDDAGK